MSKRKAEIRLNAKVITIVALILSAFCFNSLNNDFGVNATSGNLQTTTKLQINGSITQRVYLGAWIQHVDGGYTTWATETGKGLAIYVSFAALAPQVPVPNNGPYQDVLTDRLRDALPMLQQGLYGTAVVAWMTAYSDYIVDTGSTGTSFQCTSEVANGTWDNVIRENAKWIKNNFPYPLILRIDHEFNIPSNWGWGKDAAVYIAAYQRIVDIFRQENVQNVKWCWCPNFASDSGVRFTDYYPGDSYVDWIGTDIYANTWGWASFDAMLKATNNLNPVSPYEFAIAHNKPFMIAEWGLNISGDMSDAQSAVWMQGLFDAIATRSDIKMMIHWAAYEWCVLNYPQALQVYINNIALPKYSAQYP